MAFRGRRGRGGCREFFGAAELGGRVFDLGRDRLKLARMFRESSNVAKCATLEWGTRENGAPELWGQTRGLSTAFGYRLTSLEMTVTLDTGRGARGGGGGAILLK
jgi:hypothetical protein